MAVAMLCVAAASSGCLRDSRTCTRSEECFSGEVCRAGGCVMDGVDERDAGVDSGVDSGVDAGADFGVDAGTMPPPVEVVSTTDLHPFFDVVRLENGEFEVAYARQDPIRVFTVRSVNGEWVEEPSALVLLADVELDSMSLVKRRGELLEVVFSLGNGEQLWTARQDEFDVWNPAVRRSREGDECRVLDARHEDGVTSLVCQGLDATTGAFVSVWRMVDMVEPTIEVLTSFGEEDWTGSASFAGDDSNTVFVTRDETLYSVDVVGGGRATLDPIATAPPGWVYSTLVSTFSSGDTTQVFASTVKGIDAWGQRLSIDSTGRLTERPFVEYLPGESTLGFEFVDAGEHGVFGVFTRSVDDFENPDEMFVVKPDGGVVALTTLRLSTVNLRAFYDDRTEELVVFYEENLSDELAIRSIRRPVSEL